MGADSQGRRRHAFRATCPRCRTRMELGARVCDCGEDAFEARRPGEELGPLEGRFTVTELGWYLAERGHGGTSYMVVDTAACRRLHGTFRTEDYPGDPGRARQLARRLVGSLNAKCGATPDRVIP